MAARSSSQAARDSREALAASIKPLISFRIRSAIDEYDRVVAVAYVTGRESPLGASAMESASNVVVRFTTASGREGTSEVRPLIEPAERFGVAQRVEVEIGTLSADWPPPDGDHVTATVTYSDARGVATYVETAHVDLHRSGDAAISFQNPTVTETRLTRQTGGGAVVHGRIESHPDPANFPRKKESVCAR